MRYKYGFLSHDPIGVELTRKIALKYVQINVNVH
jgi:hypothetical protein